VTYDCRFLLWYGVLIYLLRLSSRRNASYDLRDSELQVLANLNRLADSQQTSLPVDKTLDYLLGCIEGPEHLAGLPRLCLQRLIRMRVLDDSRLQGKLVAAIDATGILSFSKPHCPHCLTRTHDGVTTYHHQVLEVKVLAQSGLVASMATEFIQNPDSAGLEKLGAEKLSAEKLKQDCELKALSRLAPRLKQHFPQLPLVLTADGLYCCGAFLSLCRLYDWSYVVTFKQGRAPALWREFEAQLALLPKQRLQDQLPDKTRVVYQWVEGLEHVDSEGRVFRVNGLRCVETSQDGTTTCYAWLTDLPLNRDTVVAVAWKGGRIRFKIENEGFNVQKNSGLNLEHAYSLDWEKAQAYYYLLQVGHLLFLLLEKGSLLRTVAQEYGETTASALWGSQGNIAQRLLESLRYFLWLPEAFDPEAARHCRVSFSSA
jgi:hypothetical protein